MNKLMLKFQKQLIFITFLFLGVNFCFAPRYSGLGPEVGFNPGSGQATSTRNGAFSKIYSKILDLDLNQFDIDHSYWMYKEGHDDWFKSLNIVWNPSWQIRSDSYNIGSRKGWWDHRNRNPEAMISFLGKEEFFSDPASLKFYMGVLFGRLYFIRKILNNHSFASVAITKMISKATSYVFNNDKTSASRYFVSNKLNTMPVDDSRKNNPILNVFLKKPLDANNNKTITGTTLENLIMLSGDSIISLNSFSQSGNFTTIDKNRYEGSYIGQLNGFRGIIDYGIDLKDYDRGNIGNPYSRVQDLSTFDPKIQSPFNLSNFVDKFHLPIMIPESSYCLIINLLGQVNLVNNQDGGFNILQSLCSRRAACLDVAASKEHIAYIGVGRNEPSDNNVSLVNFDPYDGKNYFFYLKVSSSLNIGSLDATKNPLNAERGKEGQYPDDIDPRLFCSDKDFAAEDGFINFVNFDSKGNLFLLTSEGKLYFYPLALLATDGKKIPTKLDCPTKVLSFSAGKGLAISDFDGKLYYLSPEDVENKMQGKTIDINAWKALSPVFQSSVFTLLNSGELVFIPRYDLTNIYLATYDQYSQTVGSLFTKIIGTDNLSNQKRLASFCHLVLMRENRTYGKDTILLEGIYPSITSVAEALNLIKQSKLFFNNIKDAFWEENPLFVGDVVATMNSLKASYGKEASFSSEFDVFQDMITQNKYFQDRSFRQKMQKLNALFLSGNGTDLANLKMAIDDLVENTFFMSNLSGFVNLSAILQSTTEVSTNLGKQGCSILLEWLRTNKTGLLKAPNVISDVHKAWIDKLFKFEKKAYINPSDVGTSAGILSNIGSLITLLGDYQLKDDLIGVEKSSLLTSLQKLIDSVSFLTLDELNEIKEKLSFLNLKFKLDTDTSFEVNGRNFITEVFSKLKIDFGVQYLITQFKSSVSSISNIDPTKTDEIKTMLNKSFNQFKEIIKLKVDFDIMESVQKSVNKAAFVNYITDLIVKDKNYKNYEDQFKTVPFSENSFLTQVAFLKDEAIINDYVAIFKDWGKLGTDDVVGNDKLINACKLAITNLSKPTLFLSLEDFNIICGSVDYLRSKGVAGLSMPRQESFGFDFISFLQKIYAFIVANKDLNTKCWKSSALYISLADSVNLFNFIKIIQNYSKFNPDFTNDSHKYGFLSILNFTKKSIEFLKKSVDSTGVLFLKLDFYLNNILNIINNVKTGGIVILEAPVVVSSTPALSIVKSSVVPTSSTAPATPTNDDF